MDTSNKGLTFGSFEDHNSDDFQVVLNVLKAGSKRVELYWEKPTRKCKAKSQAESTETKGHAAGAAKLTGVGYHASAVQTSSEVSKPCPTLTSQPPQANSQSFSEESTARCPVDVVPDVLKGPQESPKDSLPVIEQPVSSEGQSMPTQPPTIIEQHPAATSKEQHDPSLPSEASQVEQSSAGLPQTVHPPPSQPQLQPQQPTAHIPQSTNLAENISTQHGSGGGGGFENYYQPPPPPPPEYVQTQLSASAAPPPSVSRLPPSFSEAGYGVPVTRQVEGDMARGRVEDGVYTPGGPGTSKARGDRRRKRKPVEYYQKEGIGAAQVVPPPHPGGMPGYHPLVRQALDAPSGGQFVSIPSAPQASVLSAQYAAHTGTSYPTMLGAGIIQQQQQQQAAVHMMLQHQQQQMQHPPPPAAAQHQPPQQQQPPPPPQQPYINPQDVNRIMHASATYATRFSHAHPQHNPSGHIYRQPHLMAADGHSTLPGSVVSSVVNPSTAGRPLALSQTGLPPSPGNLQGMGRSPPRAPAVGIQYQDMRPVDPHGHHHSYHVQPHVSASVPVNMVPPVALQTPMTPPVTTFNLSSANPVHKEVSRTGGPHVALMPPQPPHAGPNQNMTAFVGPPQHQSSRMLTPPKAISSHSAHSNIPGCKLATAQQAATELAPATSSLKQKLPTVEVKGEQDASPKDSDVAVHEEQVSKEQHKSEQEEASCLVETQSTQPPNESVMAKESSPSEADVNLDVITQEQSIKRSPEKKDADTDTVPKSPFIGTLTFGTVQDVATMKAQSVSETLISSSTEPAPEENATAVSAATAAAAAAPVVLPQPTDRPAADSVKPAPANIEVSFQVPPAAVLVEGTHGKKSVAVVTPMPRNNASAASPTTTSPTTTTTTTTAVGKSAEPSPAKSISASKPADSKQTTTVNASAGSKMFWSSLFKNGDAKSSPAIVISDAQPTPPAVPAGNSRRGKEREDSKEPKKPVPTADDMRAKEFGEMLKKYTMKYNQVSLQPRGLYNKYNWCYINATVQALLACPAFYQLLRSLPNFNKKSGERGPTSTPVMDCMIQFVNEFTEMSPQDLRFIEKSSGKGPQRSNLDIRHGPPFEPVNILQMLQVIDYNTSFKHGRQEDAEEFMSCILNALHEEMVACMNVGRADSPTGENRTKENGDARGEVNKGQGANEDEDDDDQWEEVGPKNKSVVTRNQAKLSESPISKLFGGQMRSIFHQQGQKESATLQPFFTLQLDVQSDKVRSLTAALEGLACKETIHGYTDATTKQEVEAHRRLAIDELPPVLIMHLKCFIYQKTGGAQKLIKPIEIPTELTIGKELMSSNGRSKYPASKRNYDLFAVVNHHGSQVVGGHYTADVYHSGIQSWVHFDDSSVTVVSTHKVTQFEAPRFPYLLFYRRRLLN